MAVFTGFVRSLKELSYVRQEAVMRTYYHFQSGSEPELHAFTDDSTGDKLPAENKPWTLVRQVSLDEEWDYPTTKAVVAAGVLENGFVLWGTPHEPTSSKPVIESDRVEGTAVYAPNGHRIGAIKRLIIEKVSGRVVYAVMTFGGFLGIGSHEHAIPWDKLDYDTRLGGYRTDITEEQLRGAPSVLGDSEVWPDRKREQEVHDYWRTPPYWGGL
jgi:hypothetical protein